MSSLATVAANSSGMLGTSKGRMAGRQRKGVRDPKLVSLEILARLGVPSYGGGEISSSRLLSMGGMDGGVFSIERITIVVGIWSISEPLSTQ